MKILIYQQHKVSHECVTVSKYGKLNNVTKNQFSSILGHFSGTQLPEDQSD